MSDSAIPVIVGVAQVEQRTKDFQNAKEPIDLMVHALRSAINDTTSPAYSRTHPVDPR